MAKKKGRPTKYEGVETIRKVGVISDLLRKQPAQFLSACGIEQVAEALGVCKDTIYEWSKTYPEFSDSIKTWTTARDAALYKLAKTLPPAIWIFMTKNMLHWRDVQDVQHSGKVDSALTIKVVQVKDENGNTRI